MHAKQEINNMIQGTFTCYMPGTHSNSHGYCLLSRKTGVWDEKIDQMPMQGNIMGMQ